MYAELQKSGRFFGRFLDTGGDATGLINANVDGSGTPIDFKVQAGPKQLILLHKLIVSVRDNAQFVAQGYGGLPYLDVGIQIFWKQDAAAPEVDRTDQREIHCNGCWALYADDYQVRISAANDVVHSSMHEFSTPLVIGPGGYYAIRINDNLSGLTQHYFRVHGMLIELDKDVA